MPARASAWIAWGSALLLAAAGCDEARLPVEPPAGPLAGAASRFDPADAGSVSGRVTWEGEMPAVPPFRAPVSPLSERAGGPIRTWPNPNAPAIDPRTRGVGNAVVFLRGIDPTRARPWDLPPVRVELRDYRVHVRQGTVDRRSGFVRRGDPVLMDSVQEAFHSLQARGAAFFALTFPEPGQPCTRRLERAGVVELSSAAGYFWMRGYLFVDDHPYYTHTGPDGSFTLTQVPAGAYELVCWLPNWHEAGRELDADTVEVCRLTFRPAREVTRPVRVRAGREEKADFRIGPGMFSR